MTLPRLVASDYDGTLTDARGQVSTRTAQVLARLAERNIPLVLVTGRCLGALPPMLERVPVRTAVVGGNGAIIADPVTGGVLAHWPISAAVLAEQTRRLRDRLPGLVFGVERGADFILEAGYPLPPHGRRSIREVCWAQLVAEPATKLVARWPAEPDAWYHDEIAAVLGEALTSTHSGVPGLAEMSAPGVTKATGLAWVARRLNVEAADVLAFGDMPNDLPMLRWAGRSVGAARSHPDVLAEVDERLPDDREDGVVAYLANLLDDQVRQDRAGRLPS